MTDRPLKCPNCEYPLTDYLHHDFPAIYTHIISLQHRELRTLLDIPSTIETQESTYIQSQLQSIYYQINRLQEELPSFPNSETWLQSRVICDIYEYLEEVKAEAEFSVLSQQVLLRMDTFNWKRRVVNLGKSLDCILRTCYYVPWKLGSSVFVVGRHKSYADTRCWKVHLTCGSVEFVSKLTSIRDSPGVIIHGNELYAFGGRNSLPLNTVEMTVFTRKSPQFSLLRNKMHCERTNFNPCIHKKSVFLIGFNIRIEVFHVQTHEFTLLNLLLFDSESCFSAINSDKIEILSKNYEYSINLADFKLLNYNKHSPLAVTCKTPSKINAKKLVSATQDDFFVYNFDWKCVIDVEI